MNKRYYEHTLPIIRGSLSNTYDKILKVVIAVASAILGALGANAMNVSI